MKKLFSKTPKFIRYSIYISSPFLFAKFSKSFIPDFFDANDLKQKFFNKCLALNQSQAMGFFTNDFIYFFDCVRDGDEHLVRSLLYSDFNDFDKIYKKHGVEITLLHVACANGHFNIVKMLLQNGVKPNTKSKCKSETIQRYFPAFDPNENLNGFTALHFAAVRGDIKMTELLLKYGADPHIKCENGETVDDIFKSQRSSYYKKWKIILENHTISQKELLKKRREYRKNNPLEKKLSEKIVGQIVPIQSVAAAIRRKQSGWAEENTPLVFLFLGSSGVGKTELAKQLANYLHPKNPECFIRLDLSEFQTKHEVSKFIGSPPGYIGYEEGGQLTSKLKKTPNAIVLLDEVEKAHPDVLTVMLQLFDEGRITDGKGLTVHCPDAIFVMTSNLAQRKIAENADLLRNYAVDNFSKPSFVKANFSDKKGENGENGEKEKIPKNTKNSKKSSPEMIVSDESDIAKKFVLDEIYPILRNNFKRDEFIGRINEILFFLPFDKAELKALVRIELNRWAEKALERHKIELSWDSEVVDLMMGGYNMHYGARSIRHEVERKIVNKLALAHDEDWVKNGSKIHLMVEDGKIVNKLALAHDEDWVKNGWAQVVGWRGRWRGWSHGLCWRGVTEAGILSHPYPSPS